MQLKKIQAQATRILKVWKANREFRMIDATISDFEAVHGEFGRTGKAVEAKSRELDKLRKVRRKAVAKLNELCTRAQSGMRGYFRPDSLQYQQISGALTIPRKKRAGKAKPAPKK